MDTLVDYAQRHRVRVFLIRAVCFIAAGAFLSTYVSTDLDNPIDLLISATFFVAGIFFVAVDSRAYG